MSQKESIVAKAQEFLNKYAETLSGKEAKQVSVLANSLEKLLIKRKGGTNPRSEFMGRCMRKVEKGGEGKNMSTCSTEWKNNKIEVTK